LSVGTSWAVGGKSLIVLEATSTTRTVARAPTVMINMIKPAGSALDLDLASLWHRGELLYFLVWRDPKARHKQMAIGAGLSAGQRSKCSSWDQPILITRLLPRNVVLDSERCQAVRPSTRLASIPNAFHLRYGLVDFRRSRVGDGWSRDAECQ
jgi:hypothetical protein